jgi:phage shock protein C
MFCSRCGNSIDASSRFCAACGTPVAASAAPPPPPPNVYPGGTQLMRLRHNRMIAGVCAGFAQHYGWDLNFVRIVTALVIVFTGVGAIAYIAAWVIIPEEPYSLPVKSA